jgi:peptidyl-tRNA hydrolase, PTH1 family
MIESASSAGTTDESIPRLVVGLGNPGPRYERTLHNVGFLVVDRFAVRAGISAFQSASLSQIGRGCWMGHDIVVAKPQTYMNRSGSAVAELVLAEPSLGLIVVHDDLDLPFGRLRLKQGGGAGGHNGVSSILQSLGQGEFARLRVGVGRPAPEIDPAEHVLALLDPDQHAALLGVADHAAEALSLVLEVGVRLAMNSVNRRPVSGPASTDGALPTGGGAQIGLGC